MSDLPRVVDVYRRVLRSYERGTGMRLSADEVHAIVTQDEHAIRTAVEADDEYVRADGECTCPTCFTAWNDNPWCPVHG